MELAITLLYWVVLFNYSEGQELLPLIKNIGVHGFPFFCLLVDFVLNCYQFPLRHLTVIMTIGGGYLVVNLGTNVITEFTAWR